MTKTTKAAAQAEEIGVEELAEKERDREALRLKREAAQDERLARRAKEIMAEENARNGRGQGITVT